MKHESEFEQLKIERSIDPKSGEVVAKYFWKGKAVPRIEISGDLVEQIAGLALIEKDLTNARRWANKATSLIPKDAAPESGRFLAKDREIFDEVKGLFVASLVFYAKAYTEAKGRRAQMSTDWLDKAFHEDHKYYMNLRHNFAAHSGADKIESAASYILVIPESEEPRHLALTTVRLQPDMVGWPGEDDKYIALIDHAIHQVKDKYQKKSNVLREAAEAKGLEFWDEQAAKQAIVDMNNLVKNLNKR